MPLSQNTCPRCWFRISPTQAASSSWLSAELWLLSPKESGSLFIHNLSSCWLQWDHGTPFQKLSLKMQVPLQPLPQEVSNLHGCMRTPTCIRWTTALFLSHLPPAFLSCHSQHFSPFSSKALGTPFSQGLWSNKTGETLTRNSKWIKVGRKKKGWGLREDTEQNSP